jgi:hypothetical protein
MADDSNHDALSEAFWELTEEQIALLHPHGQVVATEGGQTLFQQGDSTCDFYVVLDGTVELVEPNRSTSWPRKASDAATDAAHFLCVLKKGPCSRPPPGRLRTVPKPAVASESTMLDRLCATLVSHPSPLPPNPGIRPSFVQ